MKILNRDTIKEELEELAHLQQISGIVPMGMKEIIRKVQLEEKYGGMKNG